MAEETKDATNKGPWPKWLPRYKDFIEIVVWTVGIVFGLITLMSIEDQVTAIKLQGTALSQQTSALNQEVKALSDLSGAMRSHVDAVTEQTKAMLEQSQVLSKQVKVSEFENRALLSIEAFQPKDITPSTKEELRQLEQPASRDTSPRFTVHFSLLNQGKSVASIDSLCYESVDSCHDSILGYVFTEPDAQGLVVLPGKGSVRTFPYSVSKLCTNIFGIIIKYSWVTSSGSRTADTLKKYGYISFLNERWHFAMLSPAQFDDMKSKMQRRK